MFSNQPGTESGETSGKFIVVILQIITGKNVAINNPLVVGMQLFIRKMAHFTIYAIGGFLIINYEYTIDRTMKHKILKSIALGGGYAVTDEIHQLFVVGRNGSAFDVGIDALGVIVGVFVYIILRRLLKTILNSNKT